MRHIVPQIVPDFAPILHINGYVMAVDIPAVSQKPVLHNMIVHVVKMFHKILCAIGKASVFKPSAVPHLARTGGLGAAVHQMVINTVIAKRQATMLMTYRH